MKNKWIKQIDFAKELGLPRQRVSQLIKLKILPTNKKGLIDFEKGKKIIEEGRDVDRNIKTESFADARTRRENWMARLVELEYKERASELIEKEKVIQITTAIIMISKTKLLSIPTKVAPLIIGIDSIKKVKSIIEKEIRNTLTELSRLNKF